jgi:hypothetical protein
VVSTLLVGSIDKDPPENCLPSFMPVSPNPFSELFRDSTPFATISKVISPSLFSFELANQKNFIEGSPATWPIDNATPFNVYQSLINRSHEIRLYRQGLTLLVNFTNFLSPSNIF